MGERERERERMNERARKANRRIEIDREQRRKGERGRERERRDALKRSDCTSRPNQHHDDVAPAESRAMIGRSLHSATPGPFTLRTPSIPSVLVRAPETRWRWRLGVIGRISVIVAPATLPPSLFPPETTTHSRLPSPVRTPCVPARTIPIPIPKLPYLSLSLPLSFSFSPSPSPLYPSCTAVNRVYPLAVAQPFNQTD